MPHFFFLAKPYSLVISNPRENNFTRILSFISFYMTSCQSHLCSETLASEKRVRDNEIGLIRSRIKWRYRTSILYLALICFSFHFNSKLSDKNKFCSLTVSTMKRLFISQCLRNYFRLRGLKHVKICFIRKLWSLTL